MPEDPTPLALVISAIDNLRGEVNRRFEETSRENARQFGELAASVQRVHQQALITNGRVTALDNPTTGRVTVLERARERGQGMVAAFKWVPWLLSSAVSAGMTILIMAVTGSLH